VRSESQFCERLQHDLLFKWFLDLNVADPASDPTTFSKNRERLLEHAVADAFFAEVVDEARRRKLLSSDHFTVDGTLLEAWASLKSYRPRDEDDDEGTGAGGRNREVDFRGQRRRRETHVSRTDPEAYLYTKGSGQTAKLCYLGHVLTENRNGRVVGVALTEADGVAERARRWRCSTAASRAAPRSAPTAATTRGTSWRTAASAESRPTLPETTVAAAARSTAGRRGTPTTR